MVQPNKMRNIIQIDVTPIHDFLQRFLFLFNQYILLIRSFLIKRNRFMEDNLFFSRAYPLHIVKMLFLPKKVGILSWKPCIYHSSKASSRSYHISISFLYSLYFLIVIKKYDIHPYFF